MKAGLNKIILEQVVENSKSPIIIQDHLKTKLFKIIDVGTPRSTFENVPSFTVGATVSLVPGTGYPVKVNGTEVTVCSFDDVLVVH
jgi:co-chaperonin GroES (HSP10)